MKIRTLLMLGEKGLCVKIKIGRRDKNRGGCNEVDKRKRGGDK